MEWWNDGGPCDFCCIPKSECPGVSKCGVLIGIKKDIIKFNEYAERHNGIKISLEGRDD